MDEEYTTHEDELSVLKQLTPQDFLGIGMDQVAYIKRIEIAGEETHTYAVHAADGSQLSVMDSYDTALAAVRMNDLYPVTLH
jgi:hypothetical protein